ncbi:hypothetical protein F5883DRAFT_430046, partial [Diaporthe sp. PMI_573]
LLALFNSLPRRCIVLLEDIDTAGLARLSDDQDDDYNLLQGNGSELKRRGRSDDQKGISLSGLLNAIDGVASNEGRVLIMTTNKPEILDDALIRPGRVDMQVEFTYVTRGTGERALREDVRGRLKRFFYTPGGFLDINGKYITTEEMKRIAADFATKIPAEFSPAELQEFLLKRKKDPRRALAEVGTWLKSRKIFTESVVMNRMQRMRRTFLSRPRSGRTARKPSKYGD